MDGYGGYSRERWRRALTRMLAECGPETVDAILVGGEAAFVARAMGTSVGGRLFFTPEDLAQVYRDLYAFHVGRAQSI